MSDFFSHPLPAVVILLGSLVLFHELGHYLVGRLCGIAVETFSIGFGPPIVRFRRGGTDYQLSWIPLGGFVKFAGAHPSEEVPPGLRGMAYRDAALSRRALTVLAGPLANFILAVLVYAVLGMDGVPHPPAVIGEVIEGSPAEAAGLRYGDKITKIGSKMVENWRHIEEAISSSPGKDLEVNVERDGAGQTMKLTPMAVQKTDGAGRSVSIGRAGVALGRLPSIVAVTDQAGPAAQAGLKTGDRIVATQVGGQWVAVTSLAEWLEILSKAMPTSGSALFPLKVRASNPPKQEVDESGKAATKASGPKAEADGPERQLSLDASSLVAAPRPLVKRTIFSALGLSDAQLTVADATEGAQGALRAGDILVTWNGKPLRDLYALHELLVANTAADVKLGILREQKPRVIDITMKGIDVQKPEGRATIYQLPILFWGQPEDPPPLIERYQNPLAALGYGLRETGVQTHELFHNITSLITGDIPLKAVGSVILIAKVAGDSAKRGWQTFLGAMALISVNLGLLNLFPIPVLDGGQLVLMGIEGVKRAPLKEAAIENFQKVGFAMILALVVLATYNDLSRFWKSMLESVVGIFQ